MIWFAVLVCLPWVNPFASGPSPAVLPLLVTFVCTGVLLLRERVRRVPLGPTLALVALACAVVWRSPVAPAELLLTLACLGVVAACVALGAAAAREPALARALAWAWLAAALLSSVAALVQYGGWAAHFQPWISPSADGTAYANLRQRNQLATLTSIGLAALLWLVQTSGSARPAANSTDRVRRGLHLYAPWMMALLVVVNAITASRTGIVQLVLLLLLVWCWRATLQRAVLRLAWGVVPVFALGASLLPWLKGAAMGNALVRMAEQSPGCGSRLVLWSNVLNLIAQKPWDGWGWRELAWAHYQGHFNPRFCQILDNAHNLPLHLAVELGLPVALLVCGVLLHALWRGRPWRESDALRQMAWAVLLCLGLHSLVEYPLWYGPFQMAAGLAVGLLWHPRPAKKPVSKQKSLVAGVLYSFFAIVLIAASLWAVHGYERISQLYLPQNERDADLQGDTLRKLGTDWLFDNQLAFARLSLTPLTQANAPALHALAQRLMHYSPEPRVIEVLIASANLMGEHSAALAEARRYQAAFPADYAAWRETNNLAGQTEAQRSSVPN